MAKQLRFAMGCPVAGLPGVYNFYFEGNENRKKEDLFHKIKKQHLKKNELVMELSHL